MDVTTIFGLMAFLGATFLVVPKIGLNVFGLYSEDTTNSNDLKKARIIGGAVAVAGVLGFFLV